jgi:hypothetical protein
MNLILNININGSFEDISDFDKMEKVFQTLQKLKTQYTVVQPSFSINNKNVEIGPMEKMYLERTGRSRMNHTHKNMNREEQAEFYLKRMEVDNTLDDSIVNFQGVLPEEHNPHDPLS